jgi:hypothetical protein
MQRNVMQKAILISIVAATIIIPMWAAREGSARRGLRKAIACIAVFNIAYLLAVMFIYPRL